MLASGLQGRDLADVGTSWFHLRLVAEPGQVQDGSMGTSVTASVNGFTTGAPFFLPGLIGSFSLAVGAELTNGTTGSLAVELDNLVVF